MPHHNRYNTAPRGFSTTEMAVVLVIIGVIFAIAIPLLRTPEASTADRRAQSSLLLAYEASRIVSRSTVAFSTNPSDLAPHAPELSFVAGATVSTSPLHVSLAVDADATPRTAPLGLAALSDSGVCWLLRAVPEGPGRGVAYAKDPSPSGLDCTGRRALRDIPPSSSSEITDGTGWISAVDLDALGAG